MLRALLLTLLAVRVAFAVNSIDQDFVCPFDGHAWKQRMETSADVKGMRLDLRQVGDVIQPPTMPQCPKCRAVLFLEKFDPKVVDALKPFIESEDFAQMASKYPSYYVLAQVQVRLKAPAYYVGHSYLRASWQAEGRAALERQCLARACEAFQDAFAKMEPGAKNYVNAGLLIGEMERRLERFEAAAARFAVMKDADAFKEEGSQRIIARQMELIAQRDSRPHGILAVFDSFVSAPATRLENAKPAPAGSTPVTRTELATPQSLEDISAGLRESSARKPKVLSRP